MKFVTVANDRHGYLNILEKQIKKSGNILSILGVGEKWGGFMWRYILLLKFLSDLPDEEIVVIMDGYDVLYINPIGLEDKFKSYKTNILYGIDNFHSKSYLHNLIHRRIFPISCSQSTKKIDVNAGIYMGYVKYLKIFLTNICIDNDCNNPNLDDQKLLAQKCNSDFFKENVKFDIDYKIFLNINNSSLFTNKSSFKLTDGKVIINNNSPNFVHGPGNTNLNFIVKSYGYEEVPQHDINKDRTKYILNGFKIHYQYFIPDIIVIITIFIVIFICCKIK